jgi:hypothetical protein
MDINALTHQLWDFSRVIGLRDRLRCPYCDAVGTWKPHGGWLDVEDERKVRRWLCKWCGAYRGPESNGTFKQALCGKTAWYLPEIAAREIGVEGVLPQILCQFHDRFIDPWYG